MRTWTFYWVSLVGMLPGTVVRVNAGTELAQIDSLHDIVSWEIIGSFFLLGLVPFLIKKALDLFNRYKVSQR